AAPTPPPFPTRRSSDLIISGGQPRDLQLVVALIAPEPRLAIIGLGVAGQPRRNAARMVGGVLHRFKPQRRAEALACEQRAVADRSEEHTSELQSLRHLV